MGWLEESFDHRTGAVARGCHARMNTTPDILELPVLERAGRCYGTLAPIAGTDRGDKGRVGSDRARVPSQDTR